MTRFKIFLTTMLLAASATAAQSSDSTLPVALQGYDHVAYFTENVARQGDARYQHKWDGALYRFASEKHLQMFRADPERYLPQYQNWCAASVSKGAKVASNPEHFLVLDNRLYLFGKPIGVDLMKADPLAVKSEADKKWRAVSLLPAPRP